MKQSIARMTLPQLLEAFSIVTHYHMPHLIQAYIAALQERVAVNTIVQVSYLSCIFKSIGNNSNSPFSDYAKYYV